MFNIIDNNNKSFIIDSISNILIDDIKEVYVLFINKKYGIKRNGNIFIDNYNFDLKHNVTNYKMNILGGKTIRYDIIESKKEIFGCYIGYELIGSNEHYTYIIRMNSIETYIDAKKVINGIEETKIIKL